jgi:hypothetical protein
MSTPKGSHPSPETKAKVSLALKGHSVSKETRKKISLKNTGYRHSDQTKANMSAAKTGAKHPAWKGGFRRTTDGYVQVKCPNHPYAETSGYVNRSRLVMEAHIGRVLLPTEVVHHINGIKDDDRIENLMLFSSTQEHSSYHGQQRRR